MKIKQLAINSVSTTVTDLPAALRGYREAGFENVEFVLGQVKNWLKNGGTVKELRRVLDSLGQRWWTPMLPCLQIGLDLLEYPRIAHGGAAYHDRVAACLFNHPLGIFRRLDISVPDHRDGHDILDPTDNTPIGMAGKSLIGITRMDSDRLCACVLCAFCELDSGGL